MYQSIESAMASEFFLDILTIWAAIRPVQRIRFGRLMLAALAGAVISGFVLLRSPSPALRTLTAVMTVPLLVFICSGNIGVHSLTSASLSMLAVSGLISCTMHIADTFGIPSPILVISAAFFSSVIFSIHRRWLETWETRIHICHSGKTASFIALIDTGNRLREPLSGLPIMIVEESLIRDILPENYEANDISSILANGFRMFSYGGVGGNGSLGCFLPSGLYAGNTPVTGIWIAPYPGKLPGMYRALAPPAVIKSIKSKRRKIKCQAPDL